MAGDWEGNWPRRGWLTSSGETVESVLLRHMGKNNFPVFLRVWGASWKNYFKNSFFIKINYLAAFSAKKGKIGLTRCAGIWYNVSVGRDMMSNARTASRMTTESRI